MKKFLLDIISPLSTPVLLVVVAFIFHLCLVKDITGDLGKLGQIVFSYDYHLQDKFQTNGVDRIAWCDTKDMGNLSILFLGDSFTKGLLYPDYLSKILHQKAAKYFVDNIETPEETFIALCNAGVEMPKVVVLESGEREFPFRLQGLDFSLNTNLIPSVHKPAAAKQTDFLTFYKNRIINNHSVLHVSLRDDLFTCPRKEKELYFYHDDLKFPEEEQIQTAITKLDLLFQLANKKDIQLFYVIAADKYDVYQDFAIDNPYPKKTVLESFSRFESNPFFVNTRPLLYEKAKKGVTDLYYADDTHWSPVGAKIVAEEIARRMDSLGVFQK